MSTLLIHYTDNPFLSSKHTTHMEMYYANVRAQRVMELHVALAITNYIYSASSGELIPTPHMCVQYIAIYDAYSLKLFIKCRLDGGYIDRTYRTFLLCTLTEEAQYAIMSHVVNVLRINTHIKRTLKRFIIAY